MILENTFSKSLRYLVELLVVLIVLFTIYFNHHPPAYDPPIILFIISLVSLAFIISGFIAITERVVTIRTKGLKQKHTVISAVYWGWVYVAFGLSLFLIVLLGLAMDWNHDKLDFRRLIEPTNEVLVIEPSIKSLEQ